MRSKRKGQIDKQMPPLAGFIQNARCTNFPEESAALLREILIQLCPFKRRRYGELAGWPCVLTREGVAIHVRREPKTVAGAALMAAALAMSAAPAFAHAAPGAAAVNAKVTGTAQPVAYRNGHAVYRRHYDRPHAYGAWGARPYAYGYNSGYYGGYSGWGYPAGYWGGYGWGPGVSVGIAPGFGIGFGF
jgi:hypothetical protein